MGFLPKGIRKTYEIGKTIGRQPPLLLVSVDTCLFCERVVLRAKALTASPHILQQGLVRRRQRGAPHSYKHSCCYQDRRQKGCRL